MLLALYYLPGLYKRDHTTLSPILLKAITELHAIKEKIEQGEEIEIDSIDNSINDIVLELIKIMSKY